MFSLATFSFEHSTGKPNKDPGKGLGKCYCVPFDHTPLTFSCYIPENHCAETPQHVDASCHLSESTSTIDSLDELSKLDAPDDHLFELDSTSIRFQLQDTSSVEIEV